MTADGLRSCTVLVVLALGEAAPVPVLMGCALLVRVASGLFRPALGAVLPNLVPEDHIQAANELSSLTTRLTGIAGPALGGVLVMGPGSTTAFAVQLGMCAISLLTLYGVRDVTPERPAAEGAMQERPSLFGDIPGGPAGAAGAPVDHGGGRAGGGLTRAGGRARYAAAAHRA